jgi:hypothetical protein
MSKKFIIVSTSSNKENRKNLSKTTGVPTGIRTQHLHYAKPLGLFPFKSWNQGWTKSITVTITNTLQYSSSKSSIWNYIKLKCTSNIGTVAEPEGSTLLIAKPARHWIWSRARPTVTTCQTQKQIDIFSGYIINWNRCTGIQNDVKTSCDVWMWHKTCGRKEERYVKYGHVIVIKDEVWTGNRIWLLHIVTTIN